MSQATKQQVSGKRIKATPSARRGAREMAAKPSTLGRGRREAFTLGHAAFAKICAVEGLHFTPEMERVLQRLEREGLSPEARRKFLIAKYGK